LTSIQTQFADPPVALIVGRFNGWKGQDTFVEAAVVAHAGLPESQYWLVGGPVPGRPEPFDRVKRRCHEIDPSGTWLQFRGPSDSVADEMAKAQIIVTPSISPEPLNLVALEAMALGKPVVATRVGGLPEVVVDGLTGLLVDPGDHKALARAMTALLSNRETAREMGRAGRDRAQAVFSGHRFAEMWRQIYRDVIDPSASLPPPEAP
jgi:glycosyltransferase involved in cell wall biosynthesis